MRSFVDTAIFVLVFGGAAFLLSFGAACAFGASSRRVIAVLVVGCAAVTALLVLWATSVGATTVDCDDCGEVLGVWVSKVVLFAILPVNLVAWIAGTALGWALRRPSRALRGSS
jgi:hypothetical protein